MPEPAVVLLTGASGGIGRAIAERLAGSGYRVFGTSRFSGRRANGDAVLPGVTLLQLDVSSPTSISECIRAVMAQAGRIDVLINNAGLIGPAAASEEADLQDIRALFETNFFGAVQVTNAVLPIMRQQGGGTIVNISSTTGLVAAPPYFAFYAASKHAMEGYSEGLRYEVRPFRIRVILIEPGYTHTEIGRAIQPPRQPVKAYDEARRGVLLLNRAGLRFGSSPDTVARAVLRALRQKRPGLRHPTGPDSAAIVLIRRILPEPLFERLIEWMYLRWKPPPEISEIETPGELGVRRFLFYAPLLNLLLKSALAGFIGVIGLAIGFALSGRRRSPQE